MADDRAPAWAVVMEQRLHGSIKDQIDAAEHRITEEVSKHLSELQRDISQRFEQARGDLTINMGAVEEARRNIVADRQTVATLQEQVSIIHKRLRDLEQRFDQDKRA